MKKSRLEAYSDGVIAIIITIMVLEIQVPNTATWDVFVLLLPTLFGYALSFVFIGIYWNNHHHLLHTVNKVTAGIMWANHNLLFWLSLVPFATAWMSKTHNQTFSVVAYAVLLFVCGSSYEILQRAIIASLSPENPTRKVLQKFSYKAIISVGSYGLAIPIAFWSTTLAVGLFVFVAIVWLVPSKSIEKSLEE
jgi:uncharacterized membrane protein